MPLKQVDRTDNCSHGRGEFGRENLTNHGDVTS